MKPHQKKRGVTPEKAQEILLKNGVQICTSKAAIVLDFLYNFAILETEQFNNEK